MCVKSRGIDTRVSTTQDNNIITHAPRQLDVDPQRDDDASPMSSYRCMSSSEVKIRISNFFGRILKFWGFHAVVLVKTFPLIYQLDVDPRRDDDASPMSTYRCMLRPT